MTSKTFVSLSAIAPRRRLVAGTIVYGLSLAVRFASATGEDVETPTQFMHRTIPAMSVMLSDDTRLPYADWSGPIAVGAAFLRRWPPRASSMPSCFSP